MAKVVKHSFSGSPRRQSGGYKPGNMNAFIYGGSRKKYKKAYERKVKHENSGRKQKNI